jgi:hypothetical protein
MIFLGFHCVCKEVNMFLYFRNNLVLKIKVHIKVSERCFLWFKLDRGSWVHLPTLSLSCGGIKRNADDQNIDMILLCYLIIFIWASRPNLKMMQHILFILH